MLQGPSGHVGPVLLLSSCPCHPALGLPVVSQGHCSFRAISHILISPSWPENSDSAVKPPLRSHLLWQVCLECSSDRAASLCSQRLSLPPSFTTDCLSPSWTMSSLGTRMGPVSALGPWVWAQGLAGGQHVPNTCPDALRYAQMGKWRLRVCN